MSSWNKGVKTDDIGQTAREGVGEVMHVNKFATGYFGISWKMFTWKQ